MPYPFYMDHRDATNYFSKNNYCGACDLMFESQPYSITKVTKEDRAYFDCAQALKHAEQDALPLYRYHGRYCRNCKIFEFFDGMYIRRGKYKGDGHLHILE